MNAKHGMQDKSRSNVPHGAQPPSNSHTQKMSESNMERGSPNRGEGRSEPNRDANIRGTHAALK